jgi:hypothetical protein
VSRSPKNGPSGFFLRGLYECGRLVVGDLVAAGGDVHDEEAAVVVALDLGVDLSRS